MSRCEFSPLARADLQEIHDYIALDSPPNALRFVDRLEQHCYLLAEYPNAGRRRQEFGPDHRSFVAPGTRYVIIYRPNEEGAQIIHARPGNQNLLLLFEE